MCILKPLFTNLQLRNKKKPKKKKKYRRRKFEANVNNINSHYNVMLCAPFIFIRIWIETQSVGGKWLNKFTFFSYRLYG